ncbi:IS110 family transposase, partial [Metabacillus herbersteinensis]
GKKGSRFSDQLRGINLEEVLIVAIDAAKLHQKALICNYFGDVIEKPFFFSVNSLGITELCTKIKHASSKANAQRIFLGVEATGHYYEDIVRELGTKGYGVQIFNAYTTFEERSSALSWCKTDDLDLVALAHAIMRNKGTEFTLSEGTQRQLLTLSRARRSEVNKRSTLQVEIRVLMDHIWREFQGYAVMDNKKRKTQKIFSDFWGKTPLFFMEHYPHPSSILKLGELEIRKLSRQHNLKMRDTTIQRLLFAANHSLSRSKEELTPELLILKMKIQSLKIFNENIKNLEKEMETLLLKTDGLLLLTVPGIGVVSAAEFYSELGDISKYDHPSQLIKKAGTNPIVKQSGGSGGYYGKISKQGNSHLRHVLYHIGHTLSVHNKDLMPFYERLKGKGKHYRKLYVALGNKFLKIAFAMLRDKKPFISNQPDFQINHEINKKLRYHSFKNQQLVTLVA